MLRDYLGHPVGISIQSVLALKGEVVGVELAICRSVSSLVFVSRVTVRVWKVGKKNMIAVYQSAWGRVGVRYLECTERRMGGLRKMYKEGGGGFRVEKRHDATCFIFPERVCFPASHERG